MDECDEDVVFDNSALYHHLREVGFSEEDVAPEQVQKTSSQSSAEPGHERLSLHDFVTHIKTGFSEFWTWLTDWRNMWKEDLQTLQDHYFSVIRNDILTSECLEEDDTKIIRSIVQSSDAQQLTSVPNGGIFTDGTLGISILAIVAGYGIFRSMGTGELSRLDWYFFMIDAIAVGICALMLLPHVIKHVMIRCKQSNLNYAVDTMKQLITEMNKYISLSKKSVRLIQETELVSRGFTLVSAQTPITRLEQGTLQTQKIQRQCPQLRQWLFHTTRDALLLFRAATCELLDSFPLDFDIEAVTGYICRIRLEEYGPCITLHGDSFEKELQEATDNYSLASLKAIIHLYQVHTSEFLKRLVLHSLHPPTKHTSPVDLLTLLQTPCQYLSEQRSVLNRSYEYHRWNLLEEKEPKVMNKEGPKLCSVTAAYTAVHSLDLHLQAALQRVRSLETYLEPLCENVNENCMSELEGLLSEELKIIKADLDACKDCWEETVTRVERSEAKAQNNKSDRIDTKRPPKSDAASMKYLKPIDLLCDDGRIIEDQVFEAYTDPSEIDSSDFDWDPMLSLEEKEKKKAEKREALRMLTELKSVISIRAADREIREKRAIEKQSGALIDKTSQSCHVDQQISAEAQKDETIGQYETSIAADVQEIKEAKPGDLSSASIQLMSNHETNKLSQTSIEFVEEKVDTPEKESIQDSSAVEKDTGRNITWLTSKAVSHDDNTDESECKITPKESPLDSKVDSVALQNRLSSLHGGNLAFSASVAALAAARSQQMTAFEVETFGASDSSSDEGVTED